VNLLFKVHDVQPAREDAAAADIAGGEDGAVLQGEEEDVVDLVNASDSEIGDGGDGRLDGRWRVGSTGPGPDDILTDSDGGLPAHVDGWLHAGLQPPAPAPAVLPDAPRLSQEQLSADLQRVSIRLEGTVGQPWTGSPAQPLSEVARRDQQVALIEPAAPAPAPALSSSARLVPSADTYRNELAADDVPRTERPWLTALTSTAVGVALADVAENMVVVDSTDPASPLTEEALQRTQRIADETEDEPLDVIVMSDNVPLDLSSLRRTLPNQWLVDEVINGCENLLRRRQAERRRSDPDASRLWFFNTFFYSRMHVHGRYDYNLVARWCGRLNLLTFKLIFVPINVANSHWVLAVMHPRTGVINIYDSLNNGNEALVPSLRK